MNKKTIGAIITIVVLLIGGYYYASPYLVLNSIKDAAQAGDSEKVSAYIDYPSVRQSFKDQMNAYMLKEMGKHENEGFAALGTILASTMVEKMIDAYVTPEGMTLMLQGRDLKDVTKNSTQQEPIDTKEEHKPDYEAGYTSFNDFDIVIYSPEKTKEVKVKMIRDGLSWKINQIIVPMDERK